MTISPDINILTDADLQARLDLAFQRGVERGRLEVVSQMMAESDRLMQKANDSFEGRDQGSAILERHGAEAIREAIASIRKGEPK
jgi:hypothetical protein